MNVRGLVVLTLLGAGIARAEDTAAWAGEYHFGKDPAEVKARKDAIAYSTETLFFVIRGAIINRLEGKSVIHDRLDVGFPAGKVRIDADQHLPVETPDSGPAVPVKIDGETFDVFQHFQGKALVQSFTSGDGNRTNEFKLADGGKSLKMKVTISSTKLSHPVVYTLTYKK